MGFLFVPVSRIRAAVATIGIKIVANASQQKSDMEVWVSFYYNFELVKRQSTAHACVVYVQEKPKHEF